MSSREIRLAAAATALGLSGGGQPLLRPSAADTVSDSDTNIVSNANVKQQTHAYIRENISGHGFSLRTGLLQGVSDHLV
jgi:hypothetical protein